MRDHTLRARRAGLAPLLAVVIAAGWPSIAGAQSASRPETRMMGERYHIEASGTLWNPALVGNIASDQLNLVGSRIDFAQDLGFNRTRLQDLNLVLRPGKKHRFRLEYQPISYVSDTTFSRIVTFAGVGFPVSLPIHSTFDWKVWRFGYEYDFIYRKRGFVGVLFEGRYTQMGASLASAVVGGTTTADAILPAIGIVGRGYVVPGVAINVELSGLCALQSKTGQFALSCKRDTNPDYQANYFDWNVFGTINLNNYVGAQVGWRRTTTLLDVSRDTGDLKFQGMWFGGVVRY